jgi:hypothetical protein
VCLPTPLAVVDAFCAKDAVLSIEPAYEAAMLREVAKSIEPLDAASMVSFANDLVEHAGHRVSFVHMPVPIARSDDAFFAPLRDLALPSSCQLFLGLLHAADGTEGALRRVRAARKVVANFGIGTECGLGRCKTPADVRILLDLHADVAKHMDV